MRSSHSSVGRASTWRSIDPQEYPNGRFAQLGDPEGNAIQLWEPAGGAEA
jgi:hypothetical protein